ncbi:MAG: alpha/beta hydrolase [Acidobacteriaceae bacterium]
MEPTLIHFSTKDHLILEADLYDGGANWLILFHGKAYSKEAWNTGFAAAAVQAGWTVLAPNLRGHGNSQSSIGACEQDVLATIEYAQSHGAKQIVALGASMGGAALLQALPHLPKPLAAIILLSPAGQPIRYDLLQGKVHEGSLLYSAQEIYADNCRQIAAHIPFPLSVRAWPGMLHAHRLMEDSIYGPEVESQILTFLIHIARST